MAPRLVFVHGIGGTRRVEAERNRWLSALAIGARDAGHSNAAAALQAGDLAEVIFAYYGDLFSPAGAQGDSIADLNSDEAMILTELITGIIEVQRDEIDDKATCDSLDRIHAMLHPPGVSQGAGDVVRRALNAATTLLGVGPWRRAGQWAGGKLLVRDLSEVARYLARGGADNQGVTLDSRIRSVVLSGLGPGPVVVVAHSLGSVVTFETLHEYFGRVPLLVTLGSPLAMRAVVWPHLNPKPPTTPRGVERWLNFWDRDDVVVARPILEDSVAPNTLDIAPQSRRIDSDGLWVHTATKYLSKGDVAGPVMETLIDPQGNISR